MDAVEDLSDIFFYAIVINITQTVEFNVQDNLFTGIDKEVCKQSVFISGEMVEFKADCDICECDPYCELKCGKETKAPKF